ncbi:Hypothetical Protein FCC1311_027862 [Hondaea fermentalgiana]|uniref:RGS domain-containing protein n=1 Tax=Hondaea fermentalgiana TaxID=2315210 RepID=A0A2R5G7P7_9STRA|nr:Hypothetical Protein FCC1311_027862 [Hondaea fermentalgiana]|eukprot:GBG26565.1 Hypothetical Protein FCC1311_027862 [Hondaea fermentalgiana]
MFECMDTQWSPIYLVVGYFLVGGLYSSICVAIGIGISYEFGVVSKEGDHLGVKRLVKRTNVRIIVFATLTSLAVMASRLGWVNRMPEHALYVIAGAWFMYDICFQPLFYVWRNWRDLHITNNILGDSRQMSEFDLLEGFINSSEGYALLLPFFKAELCVEMLLFIREVSAFEANFDDRNMSFSAAQNSDNSRGTQVSSSTAGEVATVTLSAAGEAFLQMKVREAIRIFEKFVSPGAPYEINAESGAVTTCKALIESDNVRSFMKRQSPSPFSESGRRFSSLRRGRLDSLKVAPDGTDGSGSQKKNMNSLELLDLAEDDAEDVGETGVVHFGAKYPLPTRCFSELKIQQIELMLMDLFARFCAADPANGNAWTKYCETQREIERFHTAASRSTNATKQSNNSTVSDKVASSAAYIES